MATSPEVTVKVNLVPAVERVEVVNPARGAKLGSYYRAAVRRRQDRDYVPTDVWNEFP
jgi:hypothetical protein